MKICSVCREEKVGDEFTQNKNQCRACRATQNAKYQAKYQAKYREKNKEKIAKQKAKYYKKNKEKIAKYQAEYREDNKEKIAKQKAKYREENKEKIAKYLEENKEKIAKQSAKYREENKEKIAKYLEENKEKIAKQKAKYRDANPQIFINQKARRRAKIGDAEITNKEWLNIMKSTKWKCYYCECQLTKDSRTIDHVVPLNQGGPHCAGNLVPACRSCNCSKNNKLSCEWKNNPNTDVEKERELWIKTLIYVEL